MTKKLLIFIIILAALLILYFVYNYFTRPIVKAPTIENNKISTSTDFKGPTGAPYVKGPTGPPPNE